MTKKRLPKSEYFLTRFIDAHENGYTSKAAYYKARFENETNGYLASGFREDCTYVDYRAYDSHPNYVANKR